MLERILKSTRLKRNIVVFVLIAIYNIFPSESSKILWYIFDQSARIYDTVVGIIWVDGIVWARSIVMAIVAGVCLYFVWKRLREVLFRYRVEAGKIVPILADGIIQEVKVDSYDDGYRNKWRNYTPNYNRSCRVQWVVPGFGEAKEDVFSFNLLDTKIPTPVLGTATSITYSPEEKALQFIQQYVKIWNKLPVTIHPDNIALYYANDPLLQHNLMDQKEKQDTVNPKIASWIIKRFVIPMAILIPVTIVILLLISTQL